MSPIFEPTLLLNESVCKANIKRMAERVKGWNGDFRPHFKTHQSARIAEWFREQGIERITVSSFKMARYFAQNAWKDITVAITATQIDAASINTLAAKINLNIVVEEEQTIMALERGLQHPVGVFVKVDTGYHRTGVDADDLIKIKKMLSGLRETKKLIFIGFLTHAGNTYGTRNKVQISEIVEPALQKFLALKTFLKDHFPLMQLSWGDTPSCSVYSDFYGVDEFRPGNFVFYDCMQVQIGACQLSDIAVCLAAPVIAVHPQRNEIVVHAGAVHLSKEGLELADGSTTYGSVVKLNGRDWDSEQVLGQVRSLSQEHGIISVSKQVMPTLKPGDVVGVLPVHSCLTANLMKQFLSTDGNFIEMMK
ncbi:D-serine deaminase, pyridoxal phosphate-dependent [Saccharicrinis carchari]|uniref:D-serine deaminase, pyridoxal phosphate-dependent n=1 Tax=Saccharicrinis carchari TaxID=1168039 RepID=A0A521D280_SACCC|nr:alanine racemase [Saccharicrinis carchari]SMO65000.1 D-serine deaminase, pyridoxal phosphate-dependent [Saccharicrinis carchari]